MKDKIKEFEFDPDNPYKGVSNEVLAETLSNHHKVIKQLEKAVQIANTLGTLQSSINKDFQAMHNKTGRIHLFVFIALVLLGLSNTYLLIESHLFAQELENVRAIKLELKEKLEVIPNGK